MSMIYHIIIAGYIIAINIGKQKCACHIIIILIIILATFMSTDFSFGSFLYMCALLIM